MYARARLTNPLIDHLAKSFYFAAWRQTMSWRYSFEEVRACSEGPSPPHP